MLRLFSCLCLISLVWGHGSMVEPPSRAVMADHGFPSNPRDYNWMEGFCGGKGHQWSAEIGGKCGICGDAWDAETREHEAPGGKFANGVIVRHYRPGQVITVTSHITANHVGYVEWRLCPNDNTDQDPGQDCFDREDAALVLEETGDTKFWIEDAWGAGEVSTRVRLPMMECSQCVLQWTYRNGRDWGTCNGACGAVETFKACADISILAVNTNYTTPERPSTTEAAQTTTPSNNSGETTSSSNEGTTTDNSNSNGDTCRAIGAWSGQADVDGWCTDNCLAPAPHTFCPGDMCQCWQGAGGLGGAIGVSCVATGAWAGDSGMAAWCTNNCLHDPPFCPEEMCNCS